MTTPFTKAFNDVQFALTAAYVPGSGHLAVDDATRIDSDMPSTAKPLRLSIDRRRDGAKSILVATGKTGNTFTGVAVAEGKVDIPFDAGDVAKVRVSAGYLNDLATAHQALEVTVAEIGPGSIGPQGDAGPAGPAGPTGPTGLTGPAGTAGATGSAGAKGDKGDTGATGATGATGSAGAKGDKGDKGDTGLTGPTGPTGATGPAGTDGGGGVVAATAPIAYDATTHTVSIAIPTAPVLKGAGSNTFGVATPGTDYLSPTGNGSGLTALDASNVASGTLVDARLSANVPLLGVSNTFTAGQAIAPAASGAVLYLHRFSTGSDNAALWQITVENGTATDGMALGCTSTTYTTGGGVGWLGNNESYIYYPGTLRVGTGGGAVATVTFTTTGVTVGDGMHVSTGTTTGTKIGTSSLQKLGFFGADPIAQPSSGDLLTAAKNLGLVSSGFTDGSVLHTTGDETVAGVKTFTSGITATSFSGDGSALTGLTEAHVTGLVGDLAAKAPLASPALTGTPTAPTASVGTNNTQVATTAFVLANPPAGTRVTANSGAFDLSAGAWFIRTLDGTNAATSITNESTDKGFTVELIQDATGGRSWTPFGGITWISPLSAAPTIASGPGARTLFGFKRTGSGAFLGWHVASGLDYASQVLGTPGLVSYYKLDEASGTVAADSKGANTGTYVGGPTLSVSGPIAGGAAVAFDGFNDTVSLPTLSLASVSVECWIKYASASLSCMIVEKDPVNTQWELMFSGGPLVWRGGSSGDAVSVATPSVGAWHHIVATQTGTVAKLYVDGYLAGTNASATAIGNGAGVVNIGKYTDSFYYTGSIAHVAIYNAAISAATVLDHWKAGTQKPPY